MGIPLTVFIFEFIQAILCFKSILVKKNATLEKKKVGNNEGLLSWSGNTRFSGGIIDGVKKLIWGDFLSFQSMVGYGILTNLNILYFL